MSAPLEKKHVTVLLELATVGPDIFVEVDHQPHTLGERQLWHLGARLADSLSQLFLRAFRRHCLVNVLFDDALGKLRRSVLAPGTDSISKCSGIGGGHIMDNKVGFGGRALQKSASS